MSSTFRQDIFTAASTISHEVLAPLGSRERKLLPCVPTQSKQSILMSCPPDDSRDEEFKSKLSPEQYAITRKGGTERAFTGAYHDEKRPGVYRCICCDAELFSSDHKYESGSGWPSYYQALDPKRILEIEDHSYGMRRIEVRCKSCDAHLGHVFPDGPHPTGMRYCINSASLHFEEKADGVARK